MSNLAIDGNAKVIQVLRPATTYKVAISGTAAAVTAVGAGVNVVRIVSDTDCFYTLTGTATTSSVFLPYSTVENISVRPGDILSVITAGAAGSVYVTEMI